MRALTFAASSTLEHPGALHGATNMSCHPMSVEPRREDSDDDEPGLFRERPQTDVIVAVQSILPPHAMPSSDSFIPSTKLLSFALSMVLSMRPQSCALLEIDPETTMFFATMEEKWDNVREVS